MPVKGFLGPNEIDEGPNRITSTSLIGLPIGCLGPSGRLEYGRRCMRAPTLVLVACSEAVSESCALQMVRAVSSKGHWFGLPHGKRQCYEQVPSRKSSVNTTERDVTAVLLEPGVSGSVYAPHRTAGRDALAQSRARALSVSGAPSGSRALG